VHQNITFPVHPDPISGMHCWHQKVRVRPAEGEDRYGDIFVDHARAREVYKRWVSLARPASGSIRRPIWLFRQVKPTLSAYELPQDERTQQARSDKKNSASTSVHEFARIVDWSPEQVWGQTKTSSSRPGDDLVA
jgi:hypothetical protein